MSALGAGLGSRPGRGAVASRRRGALLLGGGCPSPLGWGAEGASVGCAGFGLLAEPCARWAEVGPAPGGNALSPAALAGNVGGLPSGSPSSLLTAGLVRPWPVTGIAVGSGRGLAPSLASSRVVLVRAPWGFGLWPVREARAGEDGPAVLDAVAGGRLLCGRTCCWAGTWGWVRLAMEVGHWGRTRRQARVTAGVMLAPMSEVADVATAGGLAARQVLWAGRPGVPVLACGGREGGRFASFGASRARDAVASPRPVRFGDGHGRGQLGAGPWLLGCSGLGRGAGLVCAWDARSAPWAPCSVVCACRRLSGRAPALVWPCRGRWVDGPGPVPSGDREAAPRRVAGAGLGPRRWALPGLVV